MRITIDLSVILLVLSSSLKANCFTSTSIKNRRYYHYDNVCHNNNQFSFTKVKGQQEDNQSGSISHQDNMNQRLRSKSLPNKHFTRTTYLNRPVGVLDQYDDTYLRVNSYRRKTTQLKISTGLTFDDGDQLLVSAQKPLGMVLEERDERGCVVVSVTKDGAACRAGVKAGDLLVAVQNADVGEATFDEVMSRISNAPRVVNLRFWRLER